MVTFGTLNARQEEKQRARIVFHKIRKVVQLIYFLRVVPFDPSLLIRSLCQMQFLLPFSFPSIRLTRSSRLSFLPFAVRSILFCISFRCPTPTCRFLRHRPCSMSICIIYFVSDSSGSSWQPAIFGTTCSIDLIASAKTEFERDSLQLK